MLELLNQLDGFDSRQDVKVCLKPSFGMCLSLGAYAYISSGYLTLNMNEE